MTQTRTPFCPSQAAGWLSRPATRILGVCLLGLLMGVAGFGLLPAPGPAYAHQLHVETTQDTPPADENAQPTPDAIEPSLAPIQVDLSAVISGNIIVYTLYATNVTDQPVWDVNVSISLPANTMLLSAQSSLPFVTDYQEGIVSFYAPNLKPNTNSGPQRVHAVVVAEEDLFISTYAEASWKSMDSIMRQSSAFSASAKTSAANMYSDTLQQYVSDMEGEVPLAHLDFTGVTVQKEGSLFRVDYHVAGPLGSTGEPADYLLYIDSSCDGTTGRVKDGFGADYRVRYRHDGGTADIGTWTIAEGTSGQWLSSGSIAVNSPPGGHTITLWIPSVLMDDSRQFCWMAESQQKVAAGAPKLPKDKLPNGRVDANYTQFADWDEMHTVQSNLLVTSGITASSDTGEVGPTVEPLLAVPPAMPQLSGKLAIPLANGQGSYDVHIFSVPDGQLLQQIPNAYQPAFRSDGTHLLVTRETDTGVSVYEFTLDGAAEVPSGAASVSAYASYDLQGARIVYEGGQLPPESPSALPLSERAMDPVMLLQCDLAAQPNGGNCQAASKLEALTSVNTLGEVHGTNPVWAANDRVIYRGCPSWNGLEQCGIYAVQVATDNFGEPSFPTLLSHHTSAFPNDAKGGFFTMTARQGEDWEVFGLSLDETRLVNLSRYRGADDGLSAISPDGNWVAFVSNREGKWSVWVASLPGGTVQKLFDLPSNGPWADDEHAWVRQRLSWGF